MLVWAVQHKLSSLSWPTLHGVHRVLTRLESQNLQYRELRMSAWQHMYASHGRLFTCDLAFFIGCHCWTNKAMSRKLYIACLRSTSALPNETLRCIHSGRLLSNTK